jgi:hypothetical protein
MKESAWEFEDFLWPGVGCLRVTGTRREVHVSTPPQDLTEWAGHTFRFHGTIIPLQLEWTSFALGPDSGMSDDDVYDFQDSLTEVMAEWFSDPASVAMLERSERAEADAKKRWEEKISADFQQGMSILSLAYQGNSEALLNMEEAIRRMAISLNLKEGKKDE